MTADLFGNADKAPATDRFFLAALPDEAAAARLAAVLQAQRREHALQGTAVRPEHLHITLHHLGDFRTIPQDVIDRASRAAASLASTAHFDVVLDRLVTFQQPGRTLIVATGGDGVTAVTAFHRQLQAALVRQGVKPEPRFKAHSTLLYGRHAIPETAIEPVNWTVREIVLVHSLLGKTTHLHLARWPLRQPAAQVVPYP